MMLEADSSDEDETQEKPAAASPPRRGNKESPLNRGNKGKGKAAASSAPAMDSRDVVAAAFGASAAPIGNDAAPDSMEGDNAACEVCRRRDGDMVLCDRCEYGARHLFCFTPKIRKAPEGEWFCRACKALKRDDPLVKRCARISATFENYGVHEGEVQDVMWQDGSKKSGKKIYNVFYAPGDEQWHDLDAKLCSEVILPIDEAATREQKRTDPLLPQGETRMTGARVTIFLDDAPGQKRGHYPGRVTNVRVEQTGTVHHLIEFDAGDRHWYDLSDPKWRWKREGGGASKAKEEVRAELQREASASSQNEDTDWYRKRAKLAAGRPSDGAQDGTGEAERKRKLDGLAQLMRMESNISVKSAKSVKSARSSQAAEEGDEEEEEDDVSTSSSDDGGKQKRSGETPAREKCRAWFVRALESGDLASGSKLTPWERELPAGVRDLLSRAIEAALREAKGSANEKPYRQQARKLAENFGGSMDLREALWTGSLSVDRFVRMTGAELLNVTTKPSRPPPSTTTLIANDDENDEDDTPLVNYYGSLVPATQLDRD